MTSGASSTTCSRSATGRSARSCGRGQRSSRSTRSERWPRRSSACATCRTRAIPCSTGRSTTSRGSCTCEISSRRRSTIRPHRSWASRETSRICRRPRACCRRSRACAPTGSRSRSSSTSTAAPTGSSRSKTSSKRSWGEIFDEYDTDVAPGELAEGGGLVDGRLNFQDFEDVTGIALERGDSDTIAGSSSSTSDASRARATRSRCRGRPSRSRPSIGAASPNSS